MLRRHTVIGWMDGLGEFENIVFLRMAFLSHVYFGVWRIDVWRFFHSPVLIYLGGIEYF